MNILDQLEDLERKATPGPWRAVDRKDLFGNQRNVGWIDSADDRVVDYAGCGSHEAKWSHGSLDLIVAMRNALPALLRVAGLLRIARAAAVVQGRHAKFLMRVVENELLDALAELTKEAT